MVTHRFARAADSGDPTQIAALLTEDVTFHAPVLTQDLHGKDLTVKFLGESSRIVGNLTYTNAAGRREDPSGGPGCRDRPAAKRAARARTGRRLPQPHADQTARGEQNMRDIYKLIGGIQGPRTYHARIATGSALIEYWTCVIQGHAQQGIDVLELDTQGRVANHTVWLRPWPVTTVLRDAAIAGQLPSLPADFWLLPAAPSRLS